MFIIIHFLLKMDIIIANKTLKKAVCAISSFAALFSMAVPAANAENVKYTDPFAYAQYYHNDTGVANVVFGKHTKTTTVKFAVFDVGFNLQHEDLRDNLAGEAYWLSNGDTTNNDHGTGVAGVISMGLNNKRGGAGVAKDVKIYSISNRSTSISYLVNDGEKNTLNDAVKYCIDNNILVLNVSWSGYSINKELRDQYRDMGGMIFCSAGNGGTNRDVNPSYPSSYSKDYDNIISVTGSRNGKAAMWTEYGVKSVTLAGPCMDMLVAGEEEDYVATSGTSEA